MIVCETKMLEQLFNTMSFVVKFRLKVEFLLNICCFCESVAHVSLQRLFGHFRNSNSFLIVFYDWSDACMNIALNQVNHASLHCI